MDAAYDAFFCMAVMAEQAHSPTVLVAVRIFQALLEHKQDSNQLRSSGLPELPEPPPKHPQQQSQRQRQLAWRWHLYLLLAANPSLRQYRKRAMSNQSTEDELKPEEHRLECNPVASPAASYIVGESEDEEAWGGRSEKGQQGCRMRSIGRRGEKTDLNEEQAGEVGPQGGEVQDRPDITVVI